MWHGTMVNGSACVWMLLLLRLSSLLVNPLLDASTALALVAAALLLVELGEDLRVAEEVVLLQERSESQQCSRLERPAQSEGRAPLEVRRLSLMASLVLRGERERTSSPTLTGTPPKAGRTTRSPSLSETGWSEPSLRGAPGPTARTVPSGGGPCDAAEGRYRPEAVFCSEGEEVGGQPGKAAASEEEGRRETHLDDLCALDEDAVEERGERLDGLDREGLGRGTRERGDERREVSSRGTRGTRAGVRGEGGGEERDAHHGCGRLNETREERRERDGSEAALRLAEDRSGGKSRKTASLLPPPPAHLLFEMLRSTAAARRAIPGAHTQVSARRFAHKVRPRPPPLLPPLLIGSPRSPSTHRNRSSASATRAARLSSRASTSSQRPSRSPSDPRAAT